MNRSESKYFNTAVRMDEAFLELLEHKDFAYITVKEICAKAGVNRSTFYLHYETIGDLLSESVKYMNDRFLQHMQFDAVNIVSRLHTCSPDELYLITPKYLMPYLEYIREHKKLFCTAIENADVLCLDDIYARMFRHVFTPILERLQVEERDRTYLMAFYMQGLLAILTQWMRNDCEDSIEYIISMIQRCVPQHKKGEEEQ